MRVTMRVRNVRLDRRVLLPNRPEVRAAAVDESTHHSDGFTAF
jgi:hypothetical protein